MKPVLIALAVLAVAASATASFAEEPDVEILSKDEANDERHHHDWRQRLLRGAGKIRDAINGAVGRVRVPDQQGRTWSSSNVTAYFQINAPRVDIRVQDHSLAIVGSTSVSGRVLGKYNPRGGRQTPFFGNGKLAFELRFRFREGHRRVEVFAVQGTAAFNKLQILPGAHSRDFDVAINGASGKAFADSASKAALDEIKKIVNS